MLFQLSEELWFPNPELAEEDGLLAIGGDLSPGRLLLAYKLGIFPWFSDDTPILWYSPHERFVLFPDKLKVSSTMKKILRSDKFKITFDQDFPAVIQACATISREGEPGTWITAGMQEAYMNLHKLGHAHSVEVYQDKVLAGGLYGVAVNKVFCGESMFSRVSNASKAALISLCQTKLYKMIDCQVYTSHLESLGAEFISREKFLEFLRSQEIQ